MPPAPFQPPIQPGEIIAAKYRVEKLIGIGGVGFVVAATHVTLEDGVALKFLKPEYTTLQEAVQRFTIEARASFKIKNEHVARVLDVDTLPDGTPFIVMELLEGLDLRSILEAHRYLPIELAVDFALQTCEALAAAHAWQIVHRDIKPENLFVTQSGDDDHIKVLDFGISKVALTQQQMPARRTRATALTMMAVGTPPYMSPEQVRASETLDGRADIWSLGCVLYELITGNAPFERSSLMQSCAAVLEDQPLALREACPDVPEGLDAAVMQCLRKDPAQRFGDVAELARALAPFGVRSVHCADRCAELLAEGLRRSDPGFRASEPTLRRSTPVRISTRVPVAPPPPPRSTSQFRAPSQLAFVPPVPADEPHELDELLLLDSDLKPHTNRGILIAVGLLTLLSGTYLAVRHSDQVARTTGVHFLKPEQPTAAAETPVVNRAPEGGAFAARDIADGTPTALVVPAVATTTVGTLGTNQVAQVPAEEKANAPAEPHALGEAETLAAPRRAAAPRASAEAARPSAARNRPAPQQRPKPVARPASQRDEDPDVGF